jgi:hypothetical protein
MHFSDFLLCAVGVCAGLMLVSRDARHADPESPDEWLAAADTALKSAGFTGAVGIS